MIKKLDNPEELGKRDVMKLLKIIKKLRKIAAKNDVWIDITCSKHIYKDISELRIYKGLSKSGNDDVIIGMKFGDINVTQTIRK